MSDSNISTPDTAILPGARQNDWTIGVTREGPTAVIRFSRPPHNYFSTPFLDALADVLEQVDDDPSVRAMVLASEGRNFCAGAELARGDEEPTRLYQAAYRLFSMRKPIVAAVQGSAVGGGLGLTLIADFRVAAPSTRMAVNFVKIGMHPGFAITLLLPRIVGPQKAADLLFTGRRITGKEALAIGLADRLVDEDALFDAALELAGHIAENAPLAVEATRATLRDGLLEQIRRQTAIEAEKQLALRETEDFAEGIRAVEERRPGAWKRR